MTANRFFTLLCSAALLCALLCACGGEQPPEHISSVATEWVAEESSAPSAAAHSDLLSDTLWTDGEDARWQFDGDGAFSRTGASPAVGTWALEDNGDLMTLTLRGGELDEEYQVTCGTEGGLSLLSSDGALCTLSPD